MKRVLVDAGPLVAIFSPADRYHDSCVQSLASLPNQLFSCWPVIAEAAWLLRSSDAAVRLLLNGIAKEFIDVLPLGNSEAAEISKVLEKYRNLRPQLAAAALVYLAARESIDTIFTLDRRDFSVYRSARNRPFLVIPDVN